jgi:predicted permease
MDGNGWSDPVFAQDRTYREGELPKVRRFKFVQPGYFNVLGTALIAGRDLTPQEVEHHSPVGLVSRNFAVEYWGAPERAVGRRVRVASVDDWREIIGVVADVYDDGVSQPATSAVYFPMILERFEGDKINVRRNVTFAIRTPRAGSAALAKDVRQAIWSMDKNLPLYGERTLEENYRRSMARTSFTLILVSVAGGMALLLGIVGLYGVVAYSVSQRTREIGIRLALGAQQNLVTNMFMRDGLRLTALGVVFGVAGAVGAVRLLSSFLFSVKAVDPATYGVISVALVATSMAATYLPSRRAAAVDPAIALRGE